MHVKLAVFEHQPKHILAKMYVLLTLYMSKVENMGVLWNFWGLEKIRVFLEVGIFLSPKMVSHMVLIYFSVYLAYIPYI